MRSGSTIYSMYGNTITTVPTPLTGEQFLTFGTEDFPPLSLLSMVDNPEILFWSENANFEVNTGLVIKGTPPMPQFAYYEPREIIDGTSIQKIEVYSSSPDAQFTVTFDGGNTWKYYSNKDWHTAQEIYEGMPGVAVRDIPPQAWQAITSSNQFQFRCYLPNTDSFANKMYIRCVE